MKTNSSDFKQVTTFQAITGAVIAILRTQQGLTQGGLAESLDLTASTWSRIEKGDSALSVEQLRKLASTLNIRAGHIMDLAEFSATTLTQKGITIIDKFSDADASLMNKPIALSSTSIDLMVNSGILPIVGNILTGLLSAIVMQALNDATAAQVN